MKAMQPPKGATTILTTDLLQEVVKASRKSPRRRMIFPFHKKEHATLHRMLNAIQPDSYVQPHRHLDPPKAESIVVLKGSIKCFIFDESGGIQEIFVLTEGSAQFGIDVEPGVFHTFVALEPDTVVFEVKPGPYVQASDKDFATWSPKEGTPAALDYMQKLYDFEKPSIIRIN